MSTAFLSALVAQVAPGGGVAGTGTAPTAGTGGTTSGAGSAVLPRLALPHVEYHLLLAQLVLIGSAVVLLGASSLFRGPLRRGVYAAWTCVTGAFAIGWSWHLWGQIVGHSTAPPASAPGGAAHAHAVAAVGHTVAVDGFSLFFAMLVGCALILSALTADSYLPREGLDGPEFYVLAMLTGAGAMIMASANDLIVLFLGLEILSISLYVLTGYHHRRLGSAEAAMKYFLLGAFSSAFFLYGVALIYGATGSTGMGAIAGFLATTDLTSNGVLLAGMVFLIVGLGFKVAAVPFHVWTPDVYQGAPTPVTGFMAAVAKAAGFAALLRVFASALPTQSADWQVLFWVLAALTMLVGAVLAVVQDNVKRMLAYSSINHAGFVMLGLVAAGTAATGSVPSSGSHPDGVASSLFYLLAYTFMVIGTFAVVTVVGREGDGHHSIEAYRGLAKNRPVLALALTILLLGQAGIPFTSGFFAKLYVIAAVVSGGDAGAYALGVIAMLSAVIATFFYLRIILMTYSSASMEGADETHAEAIAGADGGGTAVATAPVDTAVRLAVPIPTTVALAISVAFTVAFGVYPGPIIHLASRATLLF